MVTALKFGGLALRVASGLAASIGRDAEKVLTQLEPPPDPQVRICKHPVGYCASLLMTMCINCYSDCMQ